MRIFRNNAKPTEEKTEAQAEKSEKTQTDKYGRPLGLLNGRTISNVSRHGSMGFTGWLESDKK